MTDYSAAKLRELIETGDEDLHRHSGHVSDPELSHALSVACGLVDGFEDSALYNETVKAAGSLQATRAAEEGNDALLGYLGGLTDDSITSSEVQGLVQLMHRCRRPGYLSTFFGRTDGGKTNFALLGSELAMHDNDLVDLVTNITSVKGSVPESRLHVVEDYPTLERTNHMLKDMGRRPYNVLDEFSSHASGYAADRGDVEETMRLFCRLLAKLDAAATVIGHDGGDVHPTMRDFSHDIVWMKVREETGLTEPGYEPDYRAEFYESVNNREPEGHRFTLSRVPQCSWSYNPDERTSWAWEVE